MTFSEKEICRKDNIGHGYTVLKNISGNFSSVFPEVSL